MHPFVFIVIAFSHVLVLGWSLRGGRLDEGLLDKGQLDEGRHNPIAGSAGAPPVVKDHHLQEHRVQSRQHAVMEMHFSVPSHSMHLCSPYQYDMWHGPWGIWRHASVERHCKERKHPSTHNVLPTVLVMAIIPTVEMPLACHPCKFFTTTAACGQQLNNLLK